MGVIKHISSKAIIAKVYRDLNLQQESLWQSMVEWIGEAIEAIGAYTELEDQVATVTVEDYRGLVPCNMYQIIQTSYFGSPMQFATSSFHSHYHITESCDLGISSQTTYNITANGKYFNTSFREGSFLVSYKVLPLDEDNFPLIPDHFYFKEALMYYIVMKLEFPKWVAGSSSKYESLKELWDEYCGKAGAHSVMPNTLDEMERIKDMMVRLIPQIDVHQGFFTNMSNPNDSIRN